MTKTLADRTQSISARFAGINGQMAKNIAEIAGVRSPAWTKAMADLTRGQSISARFAGINGQMAKNIAEIARVPLEDWLAGLGPDDLAEDHPEPEVRTESGLIIPSPTETLIFGGFQIDPERAFFAVVLTGLLLPVIMAPQLEPVRKPASWAVWLLPAIYHALGRLPKR